MSSIITPTIWTQQPQYPVGIDYGNPLAAKFSAFSLPSGGVLCNFAKSKVDSFALPSGGNINISSGQLGLGAGSTSANTHTFKLNALANQTDTAWESLTSSGTWFALVVRTGNSSGNAPIFSNGAPSAAPYTAWGIVDGSGTGNLVVECSAGGTYRSLTVSSSLPNNKPLLLVGRYNGSSLEAFINGIKQTGSTACTGNITYPSDVVSRGPALGNFYNYTASSRSFVGRIYLAGISPFALSDTEIKSLSENPWQIFQPIQPIYLGVPAASGAYTLTADSGSFTLSGTAATLTAQRKVTADSGSFALTGTAAVLKHNHVLAANSGSIALTGTAATLTYTPVGGYTLPANGGSFTLSGTAASLLASRKVVAGSGSFTLTGTAATLSLVKLLTAGSGSFTLSGTAATFAKTNVLVAGEGAYSLVGTAATLTHGVSLTDSQKIDLILDILSNRQELDVSTGMYTLYADDGVTVLYTAAAWEDAAGTIPYRGRELRRLDALV